MSEYSDLTLLNCNRSASVEARSSNDSNPAVFTNTLQQTVPLDVGDRVSVERAFVSEIGAGNPSTIEFSGKSRGRNIIPNYVKVEKKDFFYDKSTTFNPNYRLGNHRTVKATIQKEQTIDLRDNLAPLLLGYYITSNEYPNYIQQPRNFSQSGTRAAQPTNPDFFTNKDQGSEGMTPFTINPEMYMESDWAKRVAETTAIIYKQRVDNTRFTMFVKDEFCFSADMGEANPGETARRQFPQNRVNGLANGVFSQCEYFRYIERLDLEINKGFNTPSAVAEQITRKLTETKTPEVFEILDGGGFNRPITKKIESSTYKPIDAATFWNYNSANHTAYIGYTGGAVAQPEVDWISQFGYIGVKRPEIFEAGRLMVDEIVPITESIIGSNGVDKVTEWFPNNPERGFQISREIENSNPPIRYTPTPTQFFDQNNPDITLNVRYTRENLRLIRDFLDTQKLYPEIWTDLPSTEDYAKDAVDLTYGIYPDINNSRFIHINRISSDSASDTPSQISLGEDTFKAGIGGENVNKSSSAVFFEYNDANRDLFIEPKDYNFFVRPLMYGFCEICEVEDYESGSGVTIYVIGLRTRTRGGLSKNLWTHQPLEGANKLMRTGTRVGFDKHSTAFSTCLITPHSGYSNCGIPTLVTFKNAAGEDQTPVHLTPTTTYMNNIGSPNVGVDLGAYQTMTYIGANNPLLEYDPVLNRFVFKRLHTGNNVGNRYYAGSDTSSITNGSLRPPNTATERLIAPPEINSDGGNTVYKLSPRPPQFGYSPTFKPYAFANQAYRRVAYPSSADDTHKEYPTTGDNTNTYSGSNLNIEPYEIFDAHGGIYIDYWGYQKDDTIDNWTNNMWDILGFDYDVVSAPASSKNVLTKRVNNDNNGALYRPTTNAEVSSTDSKTYVTNQFNANMFYTSLPYPENIISYTPVELEPLSQFFKFVKSGTLGTPLTYFPEIAIKTESIGLVATNLQKSVLKPYYTIRSSILQGYTAIGGNPTGANLPIIDIIDKYSAANDYFMGNPSGMIFTVTKPTIISDITTSIHDPDGEYSNVDATSAVIYKIEKNKIIPQNIIQGILEEANKQAKKKK